MKKIGDFIETRGTGSTLKEGEIKQQSEDDNINIKNQISRNSSFNSKMFSDEQLQNMTQFDQKPRDCFKKRKHVESITDLHQRIASLKQRFAVENPRLSKNYDQTFQEHQYVSPKKQIYDISEKKEKRSQPKSIDLSQRQGKNMFFRHSELQKSRVNKDAFFDFDKQNLQKAEKELGKPKLTSSRSLIQSYQLLKWKVDTHEQFQNLPIDKNPFEKEKNEIEIDFQDFLINEEEPNEPTKKPIEVENKLYKQYSFDVQSRRADTVRSQKSLGLQVQQVAQQNTQKMVDKSYNNQLISKNAAQKKTPPPMFTDQSAGSFPVYDGQNQRVFSNSGETPNLTTNQSSTTIMGTNQNPKHPNECHDLHTRLTFLENNDLVREEITPRQMQKVQDSPPQATTGKKRRKLQLYQQKSDISEAEPGLHAKMRSYKDRTEDEINSEQSSNNNLDQQKMSSLSSGLIKLRRVREASPSFLMGEMSREVSKKQANHSNNFSYSFNRKEEERSSNRIDQHLIQIIKQSKGQEAEKQQSKTTQQLMMMGSPERIQQYQRIQQAFFYGSKLEPEDQILSTKEISIVQDNKNKEEGRNRQNSMIQDKTQTPPNQSVSCPSENSLENLDESTRSKVKEDSSVLDNPSEEKRPILNYKGSQQTNSRQKPPKIDKLFSVTSKKGVTSLPQSPLKQGGRGSVKPWQALKTIHQVQRMQSDLGLRNSDYNQKSIQNSEKNNRNIFKFGQNNQNHNDYLGLKRLTSDPTSTKREHVRKNSCRKMQVEPDTSPGQQKQSIKVIQRVQSSHEYLDTKVDTLQEQLPLVTDATISENQVSAPIQQRLNQFKTLPKKKINDFSSNKLTKQLVQQQKSAIQSRRRFGMAPSKSTLDEIIRGSRDTGGTGNSIQNVSQHHNPLGINNRKNAIKLNKDASNIQRVLDTKLLAVSSQESGNSGADQHIIMTESNNKRNSPKQALNPISAFTYRASIEKKAPPLPRQQTIKQKKRLDNILRRQSSHHVMVVGNQKIVKNDSQTSSERERKLQKQSETITTNKDYDGGTTQRQFEINYYQNKARDDDISRQSNNQEGPLALKKMTEKSSGKMDFQLILNKEKEINEAPKKQRNVNGPKQPSIGFRKTESPQKRQIRTRRTIMNEQVDNTSESNVSSGKEVSLTEVDCKYFGSRPLNKNQEGNPTIKVLDQVSLKMVEKEKIGHKSKLQVQNKVRKETNKVARSTSHSLPYGQSAMQLKSLLGFQQKFDANILKRPEKINKALDINNSNQMGKNVRKEDLIGSKRPNTRVQKYKIQKQKVIQQQDNSAQAFLDMYTGSKTNLFESRNEQEFNTSGFRTDKDSKDNQNLKKTEIMLKEYEIIANADEEIVKLDVKGLPQTEMLEANGEKERNQSEECKENEQGRNETMEQSQEEQKSDDIVYLEDGQIHGWLQRKSKRYFGGWKRIFVTIEQAKLRYYLDQTLVNQKGVIDFEKYQTKLEILNETTFKLSVDQDRDTSKEFVFQAQYKRNMTFWLTVINQNLIQKTSSYLSEDKKNEALQIQMPLKIAPKNFWKICHISHQELVTNAQTGDILLFTGTQYSAQILRGLISSKFDHVGMLVRYPKTNQVVLFESLSGKGVCQWDWNAYVYNNYWRENYSKIAYRRLLGVVRDEKFKSEVQSFMVKTLGKPYNMNVGQLWNGKQENDEHEDEILSNKQGFFCSELIACLLKRLNLLDQRVSSTQYWPGNFSTEDPKRSIQLQGDAMYSEEFTVDLEQT